MRDAFNLRGIFFRFYLLHYFMHMSILSACKYVHHVPAVPIEMRSFCQIAWS